MITLYIIVSYLVMLGVIINHINTIQGVDKEACATFIFSPIVLPILIGMMIGKK